MTSYDDKTPADSPYGEVLKKLGEIVRQQDELKHICQNVADYALAEHDGLKRRIRLLEERHFYLPIAIALVAMALSIYATARVQRIELPTRDGFATIEP